MARDGFRAEGKAFDGIQECFVDIFSDNLYLGGVACELDVVDRCYTVYVVDDVYIVGRYNLCAVGPVCLVAVVFLGVMGGGDVDSALASEVADGE